MYHRFFRLVQKDSERDRTKSLVTLSLFTGLHHFSVSPVLRARAGYANAEGCSKPEFGSAPTKCAGTRALWGCSASLNVLPPICAICYATLSVALSRPCVGPAWECDGISARLL